MGREFETRLFAGDTPLQHDIIWKTRAPPYTTHLHTATSLIIKILNFVQVDSRYYLGKYFEIWGVHLKMLHRYMTATDLLNLNFPPRSNVFPWYWLLAKSYRIDHFANPATEWELHICQKSRSKTSSWNQQAALLLLCLICSRTFNADGGGRLLIGWEVKSDATKTRDTANPFPDT